MKCKFEGCTKEARARRLCGGHYWQWYQGYPLRPIPLPVAKVPPIVYQAKSQNGFAKPWTPPEDEIMRANYRTVGWKKTAAMLGRGKDSVFARAKRLGLQTRHMWGK